MHARKDTHTRTPTRTACTPGEASNCPSSSFRGSRFFRPRSLSSGSFGGRLVLYKVRRGLECCHFFSIFLVSDALSRSPLSPLEKGERTLTRSRRVRRRCNARSEGVCRLLLFNKHRPRRRRRRRRRSSSRSPSTYVYTPIWSVPREGYLSNIHDFSPQKWPAIASPKRIFANDFYSRIRVYPELHIAAYSLPRTTLFRAFSLGSLPRDHIHRRGTK